MIGTIPLAVLVAPVANLSVEVGAALVPAGCVLAILVAMTLVVRAARARRSPRPAGLGRPSMTIEEEEELLRRLSNLSARRRAVGSQGRRADA